MKLVTVGEGHSLGGGPEVAVRDICLLTTSASTRDVLAFPALLPSVVEKGMMFIGTGAAPSAGIMSGEKA